MLIRKVRDVEAQEVTNYNSTKTKIQWLISKDEGAPRFAMRLFTIEKGGKIGLHSHPEEHEIFIVSGECYIISENDNKIKVVENDVIYIPPNEVHGYEHGGNKTLKFICVVPILKKN